MTIEGDVNLRERRIEGQGTSIRASGEATPNMKIWSNVDLASK